MAAGNARFDEVGPVIPLTDLVRLPPAEARAGTGRIDTEITYIDSFGNLRLAGTRADLLAAFGELDQGRAFSATVGGEPIGHITFVRSFGHVERGASVLYVDSTGDLALADNQASLAERIGAETGAAVELEPA